MASTYNKSLFTFGKIYKGCEDMAMELARVLRLGETINRIQQAKQAAMMQHMEQLISNINACKYAFELEACENSYVNLLIPSYPEYGHIYNKPVIDAINRKEQQIQQSFNQ